MFYFIIQAISQASYDLNSELLVCYSKHVLNNELLVYYSSHDLNNEPFDERTVLNHPNDELVCYSDPHCIVLFLLSHFILLSSLCLNALRSGEMSQSTFKCQIIRIREVCDRNGESLKERQKLPYS